MLGLAGKGEVMAPKIIEVDPRKYMNRAVIMTERPGPGVIVFLDDADGVTHITSTFESIAAATPTIEEWCAGDLDYAAKLATDIWTVIKSKGTP
jgi:hypothetical protein